MNKDNLKQNQLSSWQLHHRRKSKIMKLPAHQNNQIRAKFCDLIIYWEWLKGEYDQVTIYDYHNANSVPFFHKHMLGQVKVRYTRNAIHKSIKYCEFMMTQMIMNFFCLSLKWWVKKKNLCTHAHTFTNMHICLLSV